MSTSSGHDTGGAGIASPGLPVGPKPMPRRFHQARWDEPIIFELSAPGARGVLPPETEPAIAAVVGDPAAALPPGIRRDTPPALPELRGCESFGWGIPMAAACRYDSGHG